MHQYLTSFCAEWHPTAWLLHPFLFLLKHRTACGILVPRPGTELEPPAVEARSLNHWTAREVSIMPIFIAEETVAQCH